MIESRVSFLLRFTPRGIAASQEVFDFLGHFPSPFPDSATLLRTSDILLKRRARLFLVFFFSAFPFPFLLGLLSPFMRFFLSYLIPLLSSPADFRTARVFAHFYFSL